MHNTQFYNAMRNLQASFNPEEDNILNQERSRQDSYEEGRAAVYNKLELIRDVDKEKVSNQGIKTKSKRKISFKETSFITLKRIANRDTKNEKIEIFSNIATF